VKLSVLHDLHLLAHKAPHMWTLQHVIVRTNSITGRGVTGRGGVGGGRLSFIEY